MTTYPAQFTEATGFVRLDGDVVFTGSASSQPISPSGLAATGVAVVRGPQSFAFNTAGLNTGVTFYTPTVGDVLLGACFVLDTVFDGTTPKADFGSFSGVTSGILALDGINAAALGAPTTSMGAGISGGQGPSGMSEFGQLFVFSAATPLKLVVSQDGQIGGAAIGGAAGAARLYIVTATPVAL